MFERKQVQIIAERMQEASNPLMQVVVGPRQTGKSTMIAQALARVGLPHLSVSADDLLAPSAEWVSQEWQQARNLAARTEGTFLLVIDEVQKVPGWPNVVKGLWDQDRREGRQLKVILSGSSSLLLRKGLEDSLKGRFEIIRSPHWSYAECKEAFGFTLEDFLFFGGFPGAARLVKDQKRWFAYMRDAIVEPTIANDVLAREDVRKPALLRALYEMGARYSAQELSYSKMLGQLQDAGNTTTLAHYLDLLDKAGVMRGLDKYAGKVLERRRSTPRLLVYDTSLMTSSLGMSKETLFQNKDVLGHVVETAVGAHLLARSEEDGADLCWWRDGTKEVDFVVSHGTQLVAIEVKSGTTKAQGGMAAFLKRYPEAIRLVVGGTSADAVSVEDFLLGKSLIG